MAFFTKLITNFNRNLVLSQPQRMISVSPVVRIKETKNVEASGLRGKCQETFFVAQKILYKKVIERKEGKTLIIEAKIVEDPKEKNLIQPANTGACLLCAAGVDVKHTDVLILSQFLRSDGCLMPRRVTGLCKTQQKRLNKLVAMSQKAGLMPNINPANSKKDPKKRFGVRAFNVYYDEKTIEHKFYNVAYR